MASHVSVIADDIVIDILHNLQSPAGNPVSHKSSESDLKETAKQTYPANEEVTYKYDTKHHSYWGISHAAASGNPPIVMPLRISKGDSGVSYASCHHDVVAIHIDTLVPKRKDWNDSLRYLSKCIKKCINRLNSSFQGNLREDNFELLIFTDFSDLNSQLRGLSVQGKELEDPTLPNARLSSSFTGIDSDLPDAGINLRSLHILLPEGPAPPGDLQAALPISAFFLSVMKQDDHHVDVGEYSTRIDCYFSFQKHQSEHQLANFINLVHSFLLSINIKPENKEPMRDIARIGTIGRFFRQSNVLSNAFSSTNSGEVIDDPLGPPPRGLRPFDEFYKPASSAIHSSFYKWLNQFNLRLFSRPMSKGTQIDNDWTPRVFLETERHTIFEMFNALDGISDKWKEHTELHLLQDPKEDTWWIAQLESDTDRHGEPLTAPKRQQLQLKAEHYSYLETGKGPLGNPLSPSERQDYIDSILDRKRPSLNACQKYLVKLRDGGILEDILDELIDAGHGSKAAELEFYGHIIELFYKIWSDLSAPYTHHMMIMKFPHLLNVHNVKYLDLLVLSFYPDVERLCDRVSRFSSNSKTSPHAWANYSQWEIKRR